MLFRSEELQKLSDREIAEDREVSHVLVWKMRKEQLVNINTSAELPTTETPHQSWGETIQEVIQQEQEKAERRLAEERAGMEATIREQGWTQERIGKALGVEGGVLAAEQRKTPQISAEAQARPGDAAKTSLVSGRPKFNTGRRDCSDEAETRQ